MTNNNRKITWKAIVAVVLVMASLFAMSSLVNAGIGELILGEEYAAVAASASEESSCTETCTATPTYQYCARGNCPLGVKWSCGGCSIHQEKNFGTICRCS